MKARLERMLNPRLKVGEVTQTDDTITATIVTKDKDVLVQKFSIDRKNVLAPRLRLLETWPRAG